MYDENSIENDFGKHVEIQLSGSPGHSPNSILEVTSTMGAPPPSGPAASPGSASASSNSSSNKKSSSRRNAWGNLSYADLITQAIQSSPEGRLTLSQVYEWMVQNIPYFKDKGDSNSSAGWKVRRRVVFLEGTEFHDHGLESYFWLDSYNSLTLNAV